MAGLRCESSQFARPATARSMLWAGWGSWFPRRQNRDMEHLAPGFFVANLAMLM
jgi:hypothetical protein